LDTSRPRRLLFLGAWQAGRGVEDLLEAVSIARNRLPLTLDLALNSWEETPRQFVEQCVASLGLSDIVNIRGMVDADQAYQEADIVVIPRRTEAKMAFPLRIVEALAHQVPLIVTKVNNMHELVGGCGLAVPPGSPQDLAESIVRLGSDAELYGKASQACLEQARRYDSQQSLSRLYEIIRSACSKR
jgi:glycosyltransferase involved in cell wall biosynthesis